MSQRWPYIKSILILSDNILLIILFKSFDLFVTSLPYGLAHTYILEI